MIIQFIKFQGNLFILVKVFWTVFEPILTCTFLYLGLVRSLYPQHGQKNPSHLMIILHTWQRF